jgi:CheY-like chemotaxis protein
VTLQRDPLAALEWLKDPVQAVDLVITDQTMPGMTGLELAEQIAMARVDLPVLLYTGNATDFSPAELRNCGVRKLLRKPIDPKALRSALQALLQDPDAA